MGLTQSFLALKQSYAQANRRHEDAIYNLRDMRLDVLQKDVSLALTNESLQQELQSYYMCQLREIDNAIDKRVKCLKWRKRVLGWFLS